MLLIHNYHILICCVFCGVSAGASSNGSKKGVPLELINEIMIRAFAPASPNSVSAACRSDSQEYLDGLVTMTPWALNMYDASAKIPSGVLTGHTQLLGNFDECLKIESGGNHSIRGQFCSPTIRFLVSSNNETSGESSDATSISLLWSYCVPASCTYDDVATALRDWLNPTDSTTNVQAVVDVSAKMCVKVEEDDPLDGPSIAMICVLTLFTILIIGSTIFEMKKDNASSLIERRYSYFMSFSAYSNGKRLINTNKNREAIDCLNGLRFRSVCWVVFGHTFYMFAINPLLNATDALGYSADWTKMIVFNGTLCTDTFLLLSGILLSYIFMREMSKRSSFNLGMFYLHRYLRLTPLYAMIVFYYSTLLVHMGSGPLWKQWVGTNSENCQENWWINLLYVNNHVGFTRPCMDHTWYLAVDMQLFLVSPVFIYPLWRWPRVGKVLLGAGMIGTILAPFLATYIHRLPGAMLYSVSISDYIDAIFVFIYIRAYNRAGPYIIGIALGHHIFVTRDKAMAMKKRYVVLGWLTSATCCLSVLYGLYGMYQPTYVYDVVEASLYAGLHRPVWALGVAWVVFACDRGYGGPVNSILSCRLFLPLSRITYSIYLCHFMVIFYTTGTMRTPENISNYELTRTYLSNLIIIVFVSAIICLSIELPFLNLERTLMLSLVSAGSKNPKDKPAQPIKSNSSKDTIEEMNFKEIDKETHGMEGIAIITNSNNSKMYDNIGYS